MEGRMEQESFKLMAVKWNYYYSTFIINFSSYYYLNIIEGRMEQESFRLIAENDNYYFYFFHHNFIIRYYYFDFMEGKSLAGSLLKIMNKSKVFTNKKLNLILERKKSLFSWRIVVIFRIAKFCWIILSPYIDIYIADFHWTMNYAKDGLFEKFEFFCVTNAQIWTKCRSNET